MQIIYNCKNKENRIFIRYYDNGIMILGDQYNMSSYVAVHNYTIVYFVEVSSIKSTRQQLNSNKIYQIVKYQYRRLYQDILIKSI